MSRLFFGWRVVGAAFAIVVLSWGAGFYGPPIFLGALHEAHGWSLPLVSAAITVHFLLGAALVARLAGLHRRFGVASVTRGGSSDGHGACGVGVRAGAVAALLSHAVQRRGLGPDQRPAPRDRDQAGR